jgi:uncharacterized delta-60 repeat protein
MKKIIYSLTLYFILSILSSGIYSQATQDWVARYNGTSPKRVDIFSKMVIDNSGNVYVTGYSNSGSYSWDDDFVTVKFNSSGIMQWVQIYNGLFDTTDRAADIAVDNAGNVYVTGQSLTDNTDIDFVTIKYNSAGVQQWVQRYIYLGDDFPTCIAVDESGFVYVSGGTNMNGGLKFTTIKYTAGGGQVWIADSPSGDKINSMKVDNSGNVYVTGPGWNDNYNYVTIKYNSLGLQQWISSYDGPANQQDYARSIDIDNSGNVFVTGDSDGDGTQEDYATVKYNPSGVLLWSQRYNGTSNSLDFAYCVKTDASGNSYVTGRSTQSGAGYDFVTIKYNTNGVQQWLAKYNGPSNDDDEAFDLVLDASGNVYVTGSTYYSVQDFATVKYNSSGVQQWTARYDGPGGSVDIARTVKVSSAGKVYAGGTSAGSGTLQDFAVVRYSQPIGVKNLSTEIPSSYALYQNYPNPFNPSTKIKFAIPLSRGVSEGRGVFVKLAVYDILGKDITTLVNQQLSPGTYEVEWPAPSGDALNFFAGIYFYKLFTDEFTETKKMILVK